MHGGHVFPWTLYLKHSIGRVLTFHLTGGHNPEAFTVWCMRKSVQSFPFGEVDWHHAQGRCVIGFFPSGLCESCNRQYLLCIRWVVGGYFMVPLLCGRLFLRRHNLHMSTYARKGAQDRPMYQLYQCTIWWINELLIYFFIEVQVRGYLQRATMTQKQVYPWKAQPSMSKGSWKPSALELSCCV